MGPRQSDHNKWLITLTMITLSGFHCSWVSKKSNKFCKNGVKTCKPHPSFARSNKSSIASLCKTNSFLFPFQFPNAESILTATRRNTAKSETWLAPILASGTPADPTLSAPPTITSATASALKGSPEIQKQDAVKQFFSLKYLFGVLCLSH